MGLCQGRGCRPIIAGILAAQRGGSIDELPLASFRPPLRAVPLAALATEEERPVPRPSAFVDAESRLARAVAAGELNPMAVVRFWRAAEEVLYQLERSDAPALERAARETEERIRATHLVG
jgi:hypothetical protein